MSEAKHTPGPWTLGTHEGYEQADIATVYCVPTQPTENGLGQEWLYVIAQKPGFEISAEEQLANARLIAASPDMYQEIETALGYLEAAGYGQMPEKDGDRHPEHYMVKGFRAVLAKARAA